MRNFSCRFLIVPILLIQVTTTHALEITQMPGFPKKTGDGEQIFYDLDNDGVNEVIVTGIRKVFAWHIDGTPYLNNPGEHSSQSAVTFRYTPLLLLAMLQVMGSQR